MPWDGKDRLLGIEILSRTLLMGDRDEIDVMSGTHLYAPEPVQSVRPALSAVVSEAYVGQ